VIEEVIGQSSAVIREENEDAPSSPTSMFDFHFSSPNNL
jgi:hypothetical protein